MKPSMYNKKEIHLNYILERGFEDKCVFSLYVHRELLMGLLKDTFIDCSKIQYIAFKPSLSIVWGYLTVQSVNCVGVSTILTIWLWLKIMIIITIK